ncbi:unnamed protein product [Caenorhabditis sp. 36 PRJEB53466]|nr:unnamed protein product [Caenorhabditis sp. 36 PRJEB53466]
MLSGNTTMMNDYIMFRLLVDDSGRHKQKRNSLQPPVGAPGVPGAAGVGQGAGGPRGSFMIPRKSITTENEPFCSPMVPHVPIRERLARRGTSADMSDDASAYTCYAPRRRRMSLLQTLRQQNRALADSGFDMHRQRTDSESTNRDTCSPTQKASPPATPSKKATMASQIKNKIFGKKKDSGASGKVYNNGEYSQSCDLINGRSRKSPSTTNDSGRGSQGHLEEKMEAMVIEEHIENDDCGCEEEEEEEMDAPILSNKRSDVRRHRTSSCPDISALVFHEPTSSGSSSGSKKCPIAVDTDTEEEHFERVKRASSPITAADCLVERRLNRKFVEQRRQQVAMSHIEEVSDDVSRVSTLSRRTAQTEDLADFDDNFSSVVLDHFLSSTQLNFDDSDSADFSLSGTIDDEFQEDPCESSSNTATSVQTDLTLLNVEQEIAEYLEHCRDASVNITEEGMNFIAKHFFEYQSFMNIPHKAVHLHKVPASQAGTDPSMGWAPKNMLKAGKHQPAPGARANRIHRDPRPNGTKYGRAGRHEHREWGDRHGELRDEKVAVHKDAWTKFLANDDQGARTAFECDFEDRVLATEEETLQEKLCRASPESMNLNALYAAANKACGGEACELLTILTYAPTVQFVTATVKKAKALPFNNAPFARIMLFEGRRLVEQKQTTVNPSLVHKTSLDGSKPSSSSASNSSNDNPSDASFSESFLFHVPPTKLDKSHIVIELYDHDEDGGLQKIGHCVIGRLVDGTGNAHWIQMVRQHGLPVCMWHKITPS